jgi:hypothetical protein
MNLIRPKSISFGKEFIEEGQGLMPVNFEINGVCQEITILIPSIFFNDLAFMCPKEGRDKK